MKYEDLISSFVLSTSSLKSASVGHWQASVTVNHSPPGFCRFSSCPAHSNSVQSPRSRVQSRNHAFMPTLDLDLGLWTVCRGWARAQQSLISSAPRVRLPDPPLQE